MLVTVRRGRLFSFPNAILKSTISQFYNFTILQFHNSTISQFYIAGSDRAPSLKRGSWKDFSLREDAQRYLYDYFSLKISGKRLPHNVEEMEHFSQFVNSYLKKGENFFHLLEQKSTNRFTWKWQHLHRIKKALNEIKDNIPEIKWKIKLSFDSEPQATNWFLRKWRHLDLIFVKTITIAGCVKYFSQV